MVKSFFSACCHEQQLAFCCTYVLGATGVEGACV